MNGPSRGFNVTTLQIKWYQLRSGALKASKCFHTWWALADAGSQAQSYEKSHLQCASRSLVRWRMWCTTGVPESSGEQGCTEALCVLDVKLIRKWKSLWITENLPQASTAKKMTWPVGFEDMTRCRDESGIGWTVVRLGCLGPAGYRSFIYYLSTLQMMCAWSHNSE